MWIIAEKMDLKATSILLKKSKAKNKNKYLENSMINVENLTVKRA